jgi:carboxyl-terminal processing protease
VFVAGVFTCGYFTRVWTHNSSTSSYEWALETIRNNYYQDIDEDLLKQSSLEGISNYVLDKYSEYYTAEEYAQLVSSNSGSKLGVGLSYDYVDGDIGKGVLVTSVIGNSPADLAGIKRGTIVTGAKSGDTTTTFTNATQFSTYVNNVETGGELTLVTDHGDYTLTKQAYQASYCFMSTNTKAWNCRYETLDSSLSVVETTSADDVISYLPDGAAYLRLNQFYGNAKEEFAQLLEKYNAEGCTSLIIDLRSNGGGYVEVMQYISSLFTKNRTDTYNVAMTANYKSGKQEVFKVKSFARSNQLLPADSQVYVLANSGTASASEAFIGVLVSNDIVSYDNIYLSDYSENYLAHLGTSEKNKRTYGKGIMQSYFKNSLTGEVLKLTVAKIYWPNGTCIHDVGITESDGCKTVKADWVVTYGDSELQRAVSQIFNK